MQDVLNKDKSHCVQSNQVAEQPAIMDCCSSRKIKKTLVSRPQFYYEISEGEVVSFTAREVATMKLLRHKVSNASIAIQLEISKRTVECYVKNIRIKLRCADKNALMTLLQQTNILAKILKDDVEVIK